MATCPRRWRPSSAAPLTSSRSRFSDNALVDRAQQAWSSRAALAQRDHRLACRKRLAELTERELRGDAASSQGQPNKLIADALDISVRTVEVHRARVFEKMEVKSAVELTNLLRDNELDGRIRSDPPLLHAHRRGRRGVVGIGDDCAALVPAPGTTG